MMILELLLAGGILLLALAVNAMISNWHDETIKSFQQDEDNLRQRLASAISEQKQALTILRDVKAQIINYESMIDDDMLDFKND
ncbi:hypothetical protein [Maridesulfovibrio zosterae]|uniref:hypothetical protein n=1 Tax=Maridesulfovibrio zosterae TaxID=82171 RepID=UPI000403DD9A|nr:hypothetical protein [Maridesulfovibrio zosterae]